jgi:restriction system protein
VEYTEPINSRILREAQALPQERLERFKSLRTHYLPLAATHLSFHPALLDHPISDAMPALPLRASVGALVEPEWLNLIPDRVLDATALRPLMEAMIQASNHAITEFDEVFGERV